MNKYKRANLNLWNEFTEIHAKSAEYDLEGFKAGKTTLHSIELEELGNVSGKTMLHLQCHFGRDSMMWARLGAKVTGVDFSDKAIDLACSLNDELELDAQFVLSDVLDLQANLSGEFDIVFTSYGVLAWLPDLKKWGQVIAHFLKPGGTFYIVELHPFSMPLDDEVEKPKLRLTYNYFHEAEPMEFPTQGSYADPHAHVNQPVEYEWFHSMSDIINALINAGLHIQYMREFDYCVYQMLPFMEQHEDGWWRLPKGMPRLPFMFSIKATK
ncbi:MAG: class I SAM-dependent methyltransferase [Chloroflexi bacterium]|nr:class I SAM-dependent methyltransferase [Chloroflexota bacterium]